LDESFLIPIRTESIREVHAGASTRKVWTTERESEEMESDLVLTRKTTSRAGQGPRKGSESQRVIIEDLARLTPDVPVLSEESAHAPWVERRNWHKLWVVDPLDGTREFVKRNGEFTINIALVVDHEPVLGIVAAPARGLLYWGAAGIGAFSRHRDMPQAAIHVAPPQSPLRVLGSRSHASAETAGYLARHAGRIPKRFWAQASSPGPA